MSKIDPELLLRQLEQRVKCSRRDSIPEACYKDALRLLEKEIRRQSMKSA